MPKPFAEYVLEQRVMISQYRQGRSLEMSCPFEIRPDKPNGKAVLLIHGFLASPYIMRSMGVFMAEKGYWVRAILLPGHGTEFNQLRTVHYPDWLNICRYGLNSFANEPTVTEISIIGFSLGAILALLMHFEFKIKALGLIAPAFAINRLATIFPTLCYLKINHLLPDLFCTQSEPVNWGSYTRFPINAVAEVQKLIVLYHQKAKQMHSWPNIFGAMSLEDQTVNAQAIQQAFLAFPPDSSYLKIYSKADFKQNPFVTALSHVALPVSPDDLYFGKNGDYYGTLPPKIKLGEPTWRDKGKPIKRSTYNPDFNNMMTQLLEYF